MPHNSAQKDGKEKREKGKKGEKKKDQCICMQRGFSKLLLLGKLLAGYQKIVQT